MRPVEIAFNLEHPDAPFNANGTDDAGTDVASAEDEEENGTGEVTTSSSDIQENIRSRAFVIATRSVLADPHWLRVSDIFDTSKSDWELLKPLRISPDDPRYDKYCKRMQRVRKIRDYPYVMHVLARDLPYEEVAEIFVRVNSLGTHLTGADLALAQITARWPNSLGDLEAFQAVCERDNFNIDLGVLVRTLVVFSTRQCRFRVASRIPIATLEQAWPRAKDALRFAIRFLREEAGIENVALLSSPYFLIAVAVVADLKQQRIAEPERRALVHWLFVADVMAHYSTSSETKLDADLALIHRSADLNSLLEVVRRESGRTRLDASDFAGRSVRSPLYSTMFLALRHGGARNWKTGLRISNRESVHLFPPALLGTAGYERAKGGGLRSQDRQCHPGTLYIGDDPVRHQRFPDSL